MFYGILVLSAFTTIGCGKLTSFFEYEMPYEKGSYLATPCISVFQKC
jgi:hypothetical protein